MPRDVPKVMVFDLDFTLWDAGGLWCDCLEPPFHRDPEGVVRDAARREIRLYPDVRIILQGLQEQGIEVGLASRTHEPQWADRLTQLLDIDPYVRYRQIYPGSKIPHLTHIRERAGVEFSEMCFFDDEQRNIVDAKSLGVQAVLVRSGVNREIVEAHLDFPLG